MRVPWQWPRDSLNESGIMKDNSLVNNALSQKPKFEATNDKDIKPKRHLPLWPCARISSLCQRSVPVAAPSEEKAQSWLPTPFQSFQSLKERIPKGIPVGRAERVQQGVDRFVVGGLQTIIHQVKGMTYHLQEKFNSNSKWDFILVPKPKTSCFHGSFCKGTVFNQQLEYAYFNITFNTYSIFNNV